MDGDHAHREIRLDRVDGRLRSAGADHADQVELLQVEGHHCSTDAQRHAVLLHEQRIVEEGQRGVEAGRPQDRVEVVTRAVGEVDRRAVEALDARAHLDATVLDPVEEELVDDGRTVGECSVIRDGHAGVVGGLTHGDAHHQARDEVLLLEGVLLHPGELGARLAEEGLGLEVVASPHHDVGVEVLLCGVYGEVAAGVARSDDEDTTPLDIPGIAVGTGVDLLAGVGAGHLGDLLVPQVTVGHEYAVVLAPYAIRCGDDPAR